MSAKKYGPNSPPKCRMRFYYYYSLVYIFFIRSEWRRQQSILSDEEAREVEELLLAQRERENSVSSHSNDSQSHKEDTPVQPASIDDKRSVGGDVKVAASTPPPLPSQPPRIKSARTSIATKGDAATTNEPPSVTPSKPAAAGDDAVPSGGRLSPINWHKITYSSPTC